MRTTLRHVLVLALWSLLAFSPGHAAFSEDSSNAPSEMLVYYFHRTGRCHTCLAMEAWTRQVVESSASADTRRKIVLNVVNLDLPENEHYAKDFQITFNTVVIAECHDGKPLRWKNLSAVWDVSSDESSFKKYVEQELTVF
jgi:hypothetical protein